ncbi:MAG: 1-acyl-sn-glycerol-3-phosphate acyltransferase [Actinomycetota bacterium]|nr:1-acyl-sn-glycerol-3-phosphate acyltransferase [Actinomycetota bacterium]
MHIEALTRVCVDDLLSAFGVGSLRRGRRPLELLFRFPAQRLAHQVATYDRIVGELGLGAGGAWMLERMARSAEVEGQKNIPRQGPLLIVANHPGLTDTVVLFAAIPRSDLCVVAAERPFLDVLPNTSQYLLTMSETSSERFRLLRSATRHLRGGGAILTFPAGRIEPDPAVLPGAIEALEHWSASADLFARLVPRLAVVPAVVSGVLSPAALRNPLTFLRRRPKDRQWLAATLQVMVPALRNVTVRVAFGQPVYANAQGATGQVTLEETQRLIERCGAG